MAVAISAINFQLRERKKHSKKKAKENKELLPKEVLWESDTNKVVAL